MTILAKDDKIVDKHYIPFRFNENVARKSDPIHVANDSKNDLYFLLNILAICRNVMNINDCR